MRSHLGMHTVMWPFAWPELSRVAFLPGWGTWNLLSKSISAMVDCHFSQSYCPLYLPIYITGRSRVFHRGLLYNGEYRHGWSSRVKVFRVFSKEGRYSLTPMADCCLIDYPFTKQRSRYHVNGFGGCLWGLHFMRGKYRYGCAPIWRFCTISSR
jgi:hypothetical protein